MNFIADAESERKSEAAEEVTKTTTDPPTLIAGEDSVVVQARESRQNDHDMRWPNAASKCDGQRCVGADSDYIRHSYEYTRIISATYTSTHTVADRRLIQSQTWTKGHHVHNANTINF
jgi:hypothetical protein